MNGFVKSLLISSALVSVMAAPSLEACRKTHKRHEDGRFENISGKERVFPKARGKYSGILPFNGNFNEPRRTRSSAGLSKSKVGDDAARSSVQAGAGSSITTLASPASTSESASTITVSPVLSVSSPSSPVSGQRRTRSESVDASAIHSTPKHARITSPFEIEFQPPSVGIIDLSPERALVLGGSAFQNIQSAKIDFNVVTTEELTVAYGEEGIAPSGEEDDRDTFPIPGTLPLPKEIIKPILPPHWTFGVSVPPVQATIELAPAPARNSAGSQRKNNQLPSGETDITAAMTDAEYETAQWVANIYFGP